MDPNWDELIESTGRVVYGVAWRILGHPQDAEDTVQDVYLEVCRLWPGRQARDWGAVLRRIAVCRALDRLRKRRGRVGLEDFDIAERSPGPQEVVASRELGDVLRDAIARLPSREAEIFCLRFFEQREYAEIAELLEISTSAVGAALFKGRQKLEAMLLPHLMEK